MKIMVSSSSTGLKLKLTGRMDFACIRDAKEKLGQILEAGRDVVVDLSGIDETDTSAVQLLVLFKREAERNGKGCQFVRAQGRVAEMLEFFRLPGLQIDPETGA